MRTSRRDFLKLSSITGIGIIMPKIELHQLKNSSRIVQPENELLSLSYDLLKKWCDSLVNLQIINPSVPSLHGGLLCPSCARVHGRVGDAIYPLMFMAEKTGEQKYLDAAKQLYNWMDLVSYPDGSWVNDVNVSLWKGTTVFAVIALAEALMYHGHLLNPETRLAWQERIDKASEYVFSTFTMDYGNINYPVTASYALSLAGKLLNKDRYSAKGREFAHNSLSYFTGENHFLYGEGNPKREKTPKGCYSVDLGYNVEESIPSLVQYALLTKDNEVLDMAIASLKTHAEFMLPDGGWDNSWGTRNYKWTYWGSRTSDGCQPAYALLAHKEPVFYKIALENTKLLAQCTHNGLLYGGPHYVSHGILPCIHHSFAHSKALAAILHKKELVNPSTSPEKIVIPREQQYGVKFYPEIQTWLFSKGDWRGTITGYDREYTMKNGHPTGGALSMLWNTKLGPVTVASMNEYQLSEPYNMQMDKEPFNMPLTPRFEFRDEKRKFMNISDKNATIAYEEADGKIIFKTQAHLTDQEQNHPAGGAISCEIVYTIDNNLITIGAKITALDVSKKIRFYLPVISTNNEKIIKSEKKIEIQKSGGKLIVEANVDMLVSDAAKGRVFNFVPGMEAIPIYVVENEFEIRISSV